MATLSILLEVEDIAVGNLLIAIRNIPGVEPGIKTISLSTGGPQPAVPRQHGVGPNAKELITASLVKAKGGPLNLGDLHRETRLSRTSLYESLTKLSLDEVVKHGEDKGAWQLTEKAKREMVGDAVTMLPSPTKMAAKANKQHIKREPAGRASPGAGRKLLLQALAAGTNARADLIKHLSESGISPKSAQGTLKRAKGDKVVTSNGRGVYALTAKGRRIIAEPARSPGNTQTRRGLI